jgi:hypothetical protein
MERKKLTYGEGKEGKGKCVTTVKPVDSCVQPAAATRREAEAKRNA